MRGYQEIPKYSKYYSLSIILQGFLNLIIMNTVLIHHINGVIALFPENVGI